MILVLMGVSGSGKTEIGRRLATELNWPFYDADDFHSPENIRKMAQGEPLTDQDRAPWLAALHDLMAAIERKEGDAVLACSALKRAYRDHLRRAGEDVTFVYLKGDLGTLRSRLEAREDHYMKAGMLTSQIEVLEEPHNALYVDIDRTPEEIVAQIIGAIRLKE